MSVSKRTRIYTTEDVARHTTPLSCWVTRSGKVYDVSAFLPDHPGGDDLILKYAGRAVEAVMKNPDEHDHSDSAYEMLDEYVIGRLGNDDNIVREGQHTYMVCMLSLTSYRLGSNR
jgi:4-hydroxysphinganine ceramide fatty acyl 2-hydroxylase